MAAWQVEIRNTILVCYEDGSAHGQSLIMDHIRKLKVLLEL